MTSVYANERWIRERPAAMADAIGLIGRSLRALLGHFCQRRRRCCDVLHGVA